MATENRRKSHRSGTAYRGGGEKWSAELHEFVRRAPQFSALADVAEGRGRELSGSQRKLLDDFAGRLAEGAARLKEGSGAVKDVGIESKGDETT